MNCIIVDDDINCIKALDGIISEHLPGLQVVGKAKSVKEALALLEKNEVDLVFLDIEIQDESGFDLLKQIPSPTFEVIFTTAHEKYALKAIKSSCFDFLLKPIDIDELLETIERLNSQKNLPRNNANKTSVLLDNLSNADKKVKKIAIPTKNEMVFIDTDKIMYLEGDAKYTKINTINNESYVSSKNIGEFEDFLDVETFFRCHRSWIVNMNYISRFLKSDSQIILTNDVLIDVSTRKKDAFLKLFYKA